MRTPRKIAAAEFELLIHVNPGVVVEVDHGLGGYVITTATGRDYFTPFGDEAAAVVGGAA